MFYKFKYFLNNKLLHAIFQIKAMGGYTISHEKTTPRWEHNYSVPKQNKH